MDRELKNLTLNISQLAALSGVHRQTAAARLQNLPVAGGHESNLKLYRVVDIVSAFLALPPPVAEGEMDAHERKAGPEAILPLRRGADGKLGVVADIGGSGMAMFAPQYNIEINNDGTNGQIGPAALKVVYDLGKKAAADFMQQQARDGGRLSGAYR